MVRFLCHVSMIIVILIIHFSLLDGGEALKEPSLLSIKEFKDRSMIYHICGYDPINTHQLYANGNTFIEEDLSGGYNILYYIIYGI